MRMGSANLFLRQAHCARRGGVWVIVLCNQWYGGQLMQHVISHEV